MAKVPAYLSKMLNSERITVAKAMLEKSKEIRSTDSVALDWALGGGVPVGELVLFWGPPGTGKSLNAMKLVAKEQKIYPEKFAIWIDTEYSFDAARAAQMGVDIDRLIVIQSNTFEEAVAPIGKIEEDIKANKNICAIVLDSVKGLQSVNAQGQMSEGKVDSAANAYGGIAKSVNPALHVLVRIANEANILTVLTNHANMNMDAMTAKYKPYALTGGQMLKHLCSTIILLDKPENAKSKLLSGSSDAYGAEIKYGSMIRCTVNKTRRTVEGKQAEYAQNLETGEIEKRESELFRLAKGLGVIKPEGQFWFFRDPSLGMKARFESGFVDLLKDPQIFAKVLEDCRETKVMTAVEDAISAELIVEG
jgi:recombination protein RecA